MGILTPDEIYEFLDITDATDQSIAIKILDAVELWLKGYARRTFESTSYTLEKYDGKGNKHLYLKNYPVTALTRLAIGTYDAISIKNTNNNTYSTVSVTSTGITLSRSGAADASVTFAANTTMSAISAAITALGNGWSSRVLDATNFGSYASSDLIKTWGQNCNDGYEVWLKMPYPYTTEEFELKEDRGHIILLHNIFPKGKNNIFVTYTAGYSSTNMPEDLKTGLKIMVKSIFDKRDDEVYNVAAYRIGEFQKQFFATGKSVPVEVTEFLASYKRWLI